MLDQYLQQWTLSDPKLIAETATSSIYLVSRGSESVILKLLSPLGVQDEATGAIALRAFNGNGAVRLLESDANAHLLEYASGDNLIPLVKRGDDDQATHIIATILNQLHAQPVSTTTAGLVPLQRWFRSLFHKAQESGAEDIYKRAAQVADSLLANPLDTCVLHGDIHHENIRHSQRGWLVFDPKGLVGERTYDAANTLCNPVDMPALVENKHRLLSQATILAAELNIALDRLLQFTFAYAALSAAWSIEDGGDPSCALNMARLIDSHIK